MEFLMRDDVNLSAEQWQSIDSAVIQAARNVLVGRKFLQIYGPLGAGAQSVNVDVLAPAEKGSVDFFGEEEEAVKVTGRSFKELPMIYRDFVLSWRDMEQARQIGMPIDLGAVSAAANACAQKDRTYMHSYSVYRSAPDYWKANASKPWLAADYI